MEPVKNYLTDFFRFFPPYPLSGKSFFQKTLSGNGGYPPPPNGQSAKLFRNFFPRRTRNDVLVLDMVKNGPKRPYNRPKRAKNGVFGPNILVF